MDWLIAGFCAGFGLITIIALPYVFGWGGCEF